MTICIAALCQGGRTVVVASDHMITAGFLALEFEHPSTKFDILTENIIGLTAGNALANTDLFRECRSAISQLQSPSVELVADRVKEQFVTLRRMRAEDEYLRPRGFTITDFYQKGLINRLPSEIGMYLDREIHTARFPLDIIIAGVDSTGGHIYGVKDPGIVDCYDRLSYHAIGSGESHALLTIIENRHSPDEGVNKTVYLVYEAKRRAEVAQGVGSETDLGIITIQGLRVLTEDEKRQLREIYDQKISPQLEHVKNAINELPFSTPEEQSDGG